MDKTTTQITMLGTGSATVSQIYNTCFVLQTPGSLMLVDAGGGNGILAQLKKVNVQISDIHHLFVTHAHTDHVLGVIWVIRMVAQCKGYEGLLHVYGNDKVMKVIKTIIDMILAKKQLGVKNLILYHTEEKTLANRKENYTREAAENFKGRIFVPDDLEVIEL